MREPKEGELYDLKDGHGWCRHGIVYIKNVGTPEKPDLIAIDTYWGLAPNYGALERNFYAVATIKDRLTFILDLITARDTHQEEWEVYADEDRANIPIGGGRARWFVRKDARPNYERRVARLEGLIRQERSRADIAARSADRYELDLQALKNSHAAAGEVR